MGTLTRGKTYGATETVTNTNLHQLVDSATITSIDSVDFDLTATNPVHVGTSAPSDSNQRPWFDSTNDVYRVKDNAGVYQPVARGHFFTNKSGGTLATGDVVILDTANDNAVTTTTTATNSAVFGVILIGAADNAEVLVITEGFVAVLTVTGSTNNGDYLFTSTTAKKADPNAAFGSGAFARAMSTSATSVTAQLGGATLTAAVSGAKFSAANAISGVRLTDAATATITYAHGLGVVPTELRVHYGEAGTNGASASGTCVTIDGGSTFEQCCSFFSNSASAGKPDIDITSIMRFETSGGAVSQVGVVTALDATNISITWTLTGSPGSTNIDFAIMALA